LASVLLASVPLLLGAGVFEEPPQPATAKAIASVAANGSARSFLFFPPVRSFPLFIGKPPLFDILVFEHNLIVCVFIYLMKGGDFCF
jgi:hypothetical protein